MTSNQLRALSHDALVDHARTRFIGAPAAPARQAADSSRSSYVALDGVPAVHIDVYPKRRRREMAAALSRLARITSREAGLRSAAAELTYADFFATEPARQLVAS
jgi:hypothetical protein